WFLPSQYQEAATTVGRRFAIQSCAPHDELDGGFEVRRGRLVPVDDACRHRFRTQAPLLDQRHDFGEQRRGVRASGEEANPQGVESAERKRHVAAGVKAHALTDTLRRRGADGVAKTRRREAGVDDDRVAAFGLLELGAYGQGTEAL